MNQFQKIWAPIAAVVGAVLLALQLGQAFTGNRSLVTGLLILISLVAIGAGMWNYAFAPSSVSGFPKYRYHWAAKSMLVLILIAVLLSATYVLTILGVVPEAAFAPALPATTHNDDAMIQLFPLFVGSTWTYNFGQLSESYDPEKPQIEQVTGSYTEQVILVESIGADDQRIVGVRRSGENFLAPCSNEPLRSGDLEIWYVVDQRQFYTACSRDGATEIAYAISRDPQGESTLAGGNLEYLLPFEVGRTWPAYLLGGYEWEVQAQVTVTVPAGRFSNCFRIGLVTLPDTTLRWVCPGVGLVASEYHHQGSQHDFRSELISFEVKTEIP